MTLTDQLTAAQTHREADSQNYDMQIEMIGKHVEFIQQQKGLSLGAHDKAIAIIKAQIEAHKAFIGEEAA